MEIVGVVGSLRENPDDNIPGADAFYRPVSAATLATTLPMTVVIRSTRPAASVLEDAAAVVHDLDPRQAIFDTGTLDQRFQRFTATERLTTWLTVGIGLAGVLLAALGVYAVVAFAIRRRLPELGIRVSLGASPGDVRNLVLRETLGLTAIALVAGTCAALALRPYVSADVIGGTTSIALSLTCAAIGTTLAAVLAAGVPATRAGRVSPLRAIRS
jgi:ABC-type antimicrobial peptide transport system permease subunit